MRSPCQERLPFEATYVADFLFRNWSNGGVSHRLQTQYGSLLGSGGCVFEHCREKPESQVRYRPEE